MSNALLDALDVTKRQIKFVSLGAAGAAWAATSILLLLLFVIWDHWATGGVPGWASACLRIFYLCGSISWLIVGVCIPGIRRISDVYAARLIEREHTEFRNTLVGAVQLAQREELPGSVRVAIVQQAAREARQTDVRGAVSNTVLRRMGIVCGAALISFAAYWAVAPKSVIVSVRRAFGAHLAPPTRTLLKELEPAGGLRVLRGSDVVFRAKLGGEQPRDAWVRFSADGGKSWPAAQQMRLTRLSHDGNWVGTRNGAEVQVSCLWQVIAGDTRSDVRPMIVLPEPALVDVTVHYQFPRYSGLGPATQPGGDVDALVGTKVEITAHTNVPARRPVLISGEGRDEVRRVLPEPTSSTQTLTADWTITQDGSYHLQFADEEGHANRVSRFRIHARPDHPPVVDWEGDGGAIELGLNEAATLQGRASDDFGVSKAVLGYRRTSDQSTGELPVEIQSTGKGEYQIHGTMTPADFGLKVGDTAEVWLTVWDNREDAANQPAPQRADSPMRRLTVRRPAEAAPPLARKEDAPQSQPSVPSKAKDVPAKREESKKTEVARNDQKDYQLQQFLNEHDKELALLEHKLNQEMKHEGGGREQGSVPNVIPDKKEGSTSAPSDGGSGDTKQGGGDEPGGNAAHAGAQSDKNKQSPRDLQQGASGKKDASTDKDESKGEPGQGDKNSGQNAATGSSSDRASAESSTRPEDASDGGRGNNKQGGNKEQGGNAAHAAAQSDKNKESPRDEQQQDSSDKKEASANKNESQGESGRGDKNSGQVSNDSKQDAASDSSTDTRNEDRTSARASSRPEDASTNSGAKQKADNSQDNPNQQAGGGGDQKSPEDSDKSNKKMNGQQKGSSGDQSQSNQKAPTESAGDQKQDGGESKKSSGASGDSQKSNKTTDSKDKPGPKDDANRASANDATNPKEESGNSSSQAQSAPTTDMEKRSEGAQEQTADQKKPPSDPSSTAPKKDESAQQNSPSEKKQDLETNGDSSQNQSQQSESQPAEKGSGAQESSESKDSKKQNNQASNKADNQDKQSSGSKSSDSPKESEAKEKSDSDQSQAGSEKKSAEGDKKEQNQSSAESSQQSKQSDSQKQSGSQQQNDSQKQSEAKAQGDAPSEKSDQSASKQSTGSKDQNPPDSSENSASQEKPGDAQGQPADSGQQASAKGQGEPGKSQSPGGSPKESKGAPGGKEGIPAANSDSSQQSTGQSGNSAQGNKQGQEPGNNQPGDTANKELGQVDKGSPLEGHGGRQGGVSDSLPQSTQPGEDVAPPESANGGSAPRSSVDRADKLVDALERELRAGKSDSQLLQNLGWDLPKARQFVEAYRRAQGRGQRQTAQSQMPVDRHTQTRPAGGESVTYGVTPANEARTFRSDASASSDLMQGAVDPARQRVPTRYRSLLDAYYRSIASQPGP